MVKNNQSVLFVLHRICISYTFYIDKIDAIGFDSIKKSLCLWHIVFNYKTCFLQYIFFEYNLKLVVNLQPNQPGGLIARQLNLGYFIFIIHVLQWVFIGIFQDVSVKKSFFIRFMLMKQIFSFVS